MTRRGIIAAVATLALLAACGDERELLQPTETERAASMELIDQMSALRVLADTPTDRAVLLDTIRFVSAATLLAGRRTPATVPPEDLDDVAAAATRQPACVSATTATATFSGCAVAGHWVDGTISRSGPLVDAELIDVFIRDADRHETSSIDGALTFTGATIDGEVALDATWRQPGVTGSLHARVRLDHVVLDDTGCPIGGAMTVEGSLSNPGHVAARAVGFGPECGDMQIDH